MLTYDNRGGRRGYSQGGTLEVIDEGVRVAVYLEKCELKELHETISDNPNPR